MAFRLFLENEPLFAISDHVLIVTLPSGLEVFFGRLLGCGSSEHFFVQRRLAEIGATF